MNKRLTGRCILVVDDEPLIALDIAETFRSAGARVVISTSLRTAVLSVQDADLSAAILDHRLLDGDSTPLCEDLKARGIPYALYTGYAQPGGVCRESLHISKPARAEALLEAIEGLIRT